MQRRAAGTLLDRTTLLDQLVRARVVLIEAPGGFGKTTLAAQLAARISGATARASFDRVADADAFVAELRRALTAAGISDAVVAMDAAEHPLAATVRSLATRADPAVLLVDEVQRLAPDAAGELARVAAGAGGTLRLVVLGRRLPAPLARLAHEPGVALLGAAELRFDPAETGRVVVATAGPAAAEVAPALHDALDGWPAAVVVAARQLAANPERPLGVLGSASAVFRRLVDEAVAGLPATVRAHLPTLAAVPLLDRAVADGLVGPGAFDQLLDSGLALAARSDGWWALADPVREVLATSGAADRGLVVRAADLLREAGEATVPADLLVRRAGPTDLAGHLSRCTHQQLDAIGTSRLAAYFHVAGPDVLDAHPALLHRAAVLADLRDDELRREWLERAAAATRGSDPVLHRRIRADQVQDAARRSDPASVIDEATELLAEVGPDEPATRARLLLALAGARVVHDDPATRGALRPLLQESAELFAAAGARRGEALALRRLGTSVEHHLGNHERAIEAMTRCLALLRAPDRDRAMSLTYLAEVLDAVGRRDEAEAALLESSTIAARLGDTRSQWFALWSRITLAGHAGDRPAVRRLMAEVDRVLGEVPADGSGFEYLLVTADLLAGLGDAAEARRVLGRARRLAEQLDRREAVAMVEARVEAVDGDPVRAEQLLDAIEGSAAAVPGQRWVRLLERAVAVLRRGDRGRATALTAEAFEEAARQGLPDLPQRFEPGLVALLRPVLGPDATEAEPSVAVRLLGSMTVTDGRRDRTPAPGNGRTLLSLVALRRGVAAEEAIEVLWPDVDEATGRSRLRNLLNRVREQAGDVVVRDAGRLALAQGVEVDALTFERLADEAVRAGPDERCGTARRALALWSGELLPDERFAEWAAAPRERLRRRRLALLDLVVDDALERGDLDEAIRHLEAGLEDEPLDEHRHLQLVRALARQGRRAAARRALDAALRVVEELGVHPSPELAALDRQLAGT